MLLQCSEAFNMGKVGMTPTSEMNCFHCFQAPLNGTILVSAGKNHFDFGFTTLPFTSHFLLCWKCFANPRELVLLEEKEKWL